MRRSAPMLAGLAVFALASHAHPRGAHAQSPAPAATDETESQREAGGETLSELLLELGKAQQLADEDPAVGAPRLSAVLEKLHDYPTELASDEAAQAARLEGLLILARARLNLGDEAAASAALDEALRCAHGQALDAARLGPSLARLEAQRRDALGQPAPLKVSCSVPCRIFVDERETPPDTELPRGNYRVTIRATGANEDAVPPLETQIELTPESPPVELHFGPQPAQGSVAEGPESPAAEPTPERSAPRDTQGRLLPRWAEITGLVLGAAAVGTGVALIVIDGRCSGGGSPTGPNACDDLYQTDLPGYVTAGAGGALLISSGVLLGIDEARAKRTRELSVLPGGLRLRF